MKYVIDNDLHIHTRLSICSQDEGQTPAAILQYAKARGLKRICVTDHYWEAGIPCDTVVNWWYEKQNFDYIAQSLPLPQDDEVEFLFGCETDTDSVDTVGVNKARWNDFGFIIVSTTHFQHMDGPGWQDKSPQAVANRWVSRLDALLNAELPFKKTGIAHLACGLIDNRSREACLAALESIPTAEMESLFTKAAQLGVGIELNAGDMCFAPQEEDTILRMFRIAKACGCKFYLGSDAHGRESFAHVDEIFERAIDLLDLQESDKFIPAKC